MTLIKKITSAIWDMVDAKIGVDKADLRSRNQLLCEQINAIVRISPAMATGTAVVAALMLAVSYNTAAMATVTLWAVALTGAFAIGVRSWFYSRNRHQERNNPEKAARRAILNAIVLGCLWGILPILVFSVDTPELNVAVPVAICAVLFGAVIAFTPLPQAALAFLLPTLAGSLAGTRFMAEPFVADVLVLLIVCFVPIMGIVIVRSSGSFVEHVVREMKFRDQKKVISLLLRDFEENSSDWLWEFGANGEVERASDRFVKAIGLSEENLVGKNFLELLRSLTAPSDPQFAEIEQAISGKRTFNKVEVVIKKGARDAVWRVTGKAAYDHNGNYTGYIGTASDITSEKSAETKANYLAHYDALTGLINRARFSESLNQCVSRLERYGSAFTVFYLDLDRFKLVNDCNGHLIGDKLLTEVAKRIRAEVRESDIVARLGGDEFAIILPNLSESSEAAMMAERLVKSIEALFEIDGETLSIGLSVGIAMAPINGTRPDQILRNADLALYRAKEEGRGMYRFFETEMDSTARERRMLEVELRQALKDGELMLHYQPLVSAEDGIASGFEALMRWNHPIRGIVPPSEFIPIAEQSGLIREIGDWTIQEACRAAAQWPNEFTVAVNLSPKHFILSDIEYVVREALDASGLEPSRLELEITESLLIDRSDDVVAKLTRLKELGTTIAMDDFGTGYSSLSYLLKFPFDKIKIDRSFVTALSDDPAARDVLRSIIALGKTLKMNITAEGVENNEQANFLREVACNQFQGFLFSKPMGTDELAGYMLARLRSPKDAPGKFGEKTRKLA